MTWFYAYLAIGAIYGAVCLFRLDGIEAPLENSLNATRKKFDPDKELPDSFVKVLESVSVFVSVFLSALFWIVVLPFDLFLSLKK